MTRKGRHHVKKPAKRYAKRAVRKIWPTKIAALIASAIQDLRETKGSTSRKIVGYINYASDKGPNQIKRQVNSVLKRGVEYGILKRYRGNYYLPTGDELCRANRIALRFAKLPLPVALSTKSNTFASRKVRPLGNQRSPWRSGLCSQNTKRLVRPRTTLIQPVVSMTGDEISNADNA